MKQMEVHAAEVSYDDGTMVEYAVVGQNEIQARDVLVRHLSGSPRWKSIRLRDTAHAPVDGPARVLGKMGDDWKP